MTTLTEFLLARIAEDEQRFHDHAEAHAEECRNDGMPDTTREEVEAYWLRPKGVGTDEVERAGTGWPRYLAECEAKRAIVEWHDETEDCCEERRGPITFIPESEQEISVDGSDGYSVSFATQPYYGCVTLMMLALPYADHADYRQEWRP